MVSARVDLRVETGHGRVLKPAGGSIGGLLFWKMIEGHVDTDLKVSDNSRTACTRECLPNRRTTGGY